jgi:carboxyl-terminal processing protease
MMNMKNIQSIFRKPRKWLLILLLGGMSFGSLAFVNNYFELSKNIEIFTALYREVNTYYVDEIDPAKFMRTGIDAMLKSLDPYTDYISESEIEDFRFMTTGQYGGIGALISKKEDDVMIADPYEGFPAQKADLRAGDILLEVAGEPMRGKNTEDVSKLLKGQPKTEVKVKIKRIGEDKPMEKVLVREEIKVNSVAYSGMIDGEVGYINLSGFRTNAASEVQKAFADLKKQGMKKLVFDLRGNLGGSLDEAIRICGMFVPRGSVVVDTKGKVKEWDKTYRTTNEPIDAQMPMVVLIDGSSASASEIVSGVVQDYDRGVVIGQKSFGKGLVQTVRPLTYNTQVKITTAKYYIPSGRCIQAINYSEKDNQNRPVKTPDSLRTAFKTRNGRVVYDAGGVTPDLSIPVRQMSNITAVLVGKRLVFDFATQFRSKNASIPAPEKFVVTDAIYKEFLDFIKDKDYTYTTESERVLNDFKEKATKEEYFAGIEAEYNALLEKKKRDKSQDVVKHQDEIKEMLAQEIVSRYYFQQGRLRASFKEDPEMKEALAVLANEGKYKSILSGK